jgi:hypothetical protein
VSGSFILRSLVIVQITIFRLTTSWSVVVFLPMFTCLSATYNLTYFYALFVSRNLTYIYDQHYLVLPHISRNLKSFLFWDITPYSLVKVSWCFGGIFRHHFQGWRISQARKPRGKQIHLHATCFQANSLFGLFFDPEDGCDVFLLNIS